MVQIHLYRPDNADRFVVLSRQVIDLNREIVTRRTAEAQREELLRAEQATRARLQRLTAALAASATLEQVAWAVHETATPVLDVDRGTLELHSQCLTPALEPGEDQQLSAGTAWSDLDQAGPSPATVPDTALRVPLEANGLALGTLTIHTGTAEASEPAFLTAVAQQIAQAVCRAGLYEHEHRVAELLQLGGRRHGGRTLQPALAAVQVPAVDGPQQPGRIEHVGQPVLDRVGVAERVRQHRGHAELVGQAHGARGQPQRARTDALPAQIHGLQPQPLSRELPPRREQLLGDVGAAGGQGGPGPVRRRDRAGPAGRCRRTRARPARTRPAGPRPSRRARQTRDGTAAPTRRGSARAG